MPFVNISTIQLTNLLTGPLALSLNLPDGGLVAARLEAGASFTLPPTVGLDMLNRCADFHTLIDSGRAAMTLGQGTGDIAGIPASNSALMMSTAGVSIQSGTAATDPGTGVVTVTFNKEMANNTYAAFFQATDPLAVISVVKDTPTMDIADTAMVGGGTAVDWMIVGTLA